MKTRFAMISILLFVVAATSVSAYDYEGTCYTTGCNDYNEVSTAEVLARYAGADYYLSAEATYTGDYAYATINWMVDTVAGVTARDTDGKITRSGTLPFSGVFWARMVAQSGSVPGAYACALVGL